MNENKKIITEYILKKFWEKAEAKLNETINKSIITLKEEISKEITNKVTELIADAPEDFDTLKEISDWISTHEESAAAMNSKIETNKENFKNYTTTEDLNKKLSGLLKGTINGTTITLTAI